MSKRFCEVGDILTYEQLEKSGFEFRLNCLGFDVWSDGNTEIHVHPQCSRLKVVGINSKTKQDENLAHA